MMELTVSGYRLRKMNLDMRNVLAFYTEEDLQVFKYWVFITFEETTLQIFFFYLIVCTGIVLMVSPIPPVRCWSCDNKITYRVPEPTGPVLVTAALTDILYPLIICHLFPPVRCWSCDSKIHTQGARAYRSGTSYGCPHRYTVPIIICPQSPPVRCWSCDNKITYRVPEPTGPVLVMAALTDILYPL